MPTWPPPSVLEPYSCSPHSIQDPVLRFEVDQGYSVRRSRHSRSRRLYQVMYFAATHELLIITDFIEREIRGGALSFAWTYPYPQAITAISAASPNVVTTTYVHGLQSQDHVDITGTLTHNGRYQITRVGPTQFALNGVTGGSPEGSGGSVAIHLPYATLLLDNDTMPAPDIMHGWNAFRDNVGLARLPLTIREEFG
jgi:phage-related protein